MQTYYHYTKGNNLVSILQDEQIGLSQGSLPSLASKKNSFVWFTIDQEYPRSALSCIPDLPETHLLKRLAEQKPSIDLIKVSERCGGLWWFVINIQAKPFIKPWMGSLSQAGYKKTAVGMTLKKLQRLLGIRQNFGDLT